MSEPDSGKDPPQPGLSDSEQEEAERRTSLRADIVYQAIYNEGESELERPASALAWSGLAAGLSMGFSLVAEGLLRAHLPDAPWRPLISHLGYSIGFLIVILGRQQLFTENTLTVILPLLRRRDAGTFRQVLRLWSVVLAANLLGGFLFASIIGLTAVFEPPIREAFTEVGTDAMGGDFATVLIRAIFAGWLIALTVWLLPFAESARILVIILITYLVTLGRFPHVIAGSADVFYLVVTGEISWQSCLGFMAPTLLGNTVGGVALVAAVNHAQVVAGRGADV